jgi:cytochrome c-type biogenesis protein CcmH/NrfF
MKSLISYTLFLPLLAYLAVFATNRPLWTLTGNVNLFWIYSIENIPIVLLISIFFALYIILVWLLLQFSNIFAYFKTKKLEGQVDKLKAELHDGQESLVNQIAKSMAEIMWDFRKETNDMITKLKSENEKYMTQTGYDIRSIKDKMEKWEKE